MMAQLQLRDPIADAAASLLIPGLGQWLQRRRAAAIYFAGDVTAAALVGGLVPGIRSLAWTAAVVIAVWSVVDAAMAARRR